MAKVVQTELDEKDFSVFKRALKRRGVTVKDGAREAIKQWSRAQMSIEDDPLFMVKPVRTGVRTDSSDLDGEAYRKVSG